MSYPSLNASSKALPPPSSPKKRLLPSFVQKRRSSHDLPMMAAPPPPRPLHTHSSPAGTLGMGAQVVSTPEEALNSWRRESVELKLLDRNRQSLSVVPGEYSPQRTLSSRRPSYTSVQEEDQLPSPPSSSAGSAPDMDRSRISQQSFPPPTMPAPLASTSFSSTLLSSKTVRLPRQPFAVESNTTLVQLQVAGQTFIIPLANLQRSQSNLAHFVGACLEIEDESDANETDDDGAASSHAGGSARYSADSDDLLPPTFTPPPNLRQSSLSKLERLGVLPPPQPSRRPDSSSSASLTTPRADTFPPTASYHPSPARSVARSTSSRTPARSSIQGPSTRFLNLLLLRSPEPYTAIAYFYSSGALLPSLRAMVAEGGADEECKGGCPLCGEAERLRRLREVEAEAKWLGLTALVSLCKAEGRKKEGSSPTTTKPATPRKGAGWI